MKIKDYRCKCGHIDFFSADKGNQKGIYCSHCGRWLKWADKNEQNLTLKQEPCEDCVRREDVINALLDWRATEFVTKTNPLFYLGKRMRELPPIQPTRPHGEWIPITKDSQVWQCSICGNGVCISEEYLKIHHRYCGQCGAQMDLEDKDECI